MSPATCDDNTPLLVPACLLVLLPLQQLVRRVARAEQQQQMMMTMTMQQQQIGRLSLTQSP